MLPRRNRTSATAFALLLAAGWGSFLPVWAAERPRIYAIQNATVVPAPGERIEDGIVVLRDGLIEAVGFGVPIPADATPIDAAGGFVYAAWIDAHGDLGLPPGKPATAGRASNEEAAAGPVHPVSRIRPERRARDGLLPFTGERKDAMVRLRERGFGAVLVTPDNGVLRGSSVAILLCEDRAVPELILRDDVAQHAAFERGGFGRSYPTSLMGSVAAIRQAMLDAERYRDWAIRYQEDPGGLRRPEFHAAYESLLPTLEGKQPVFFSVGDPRDTLLAHRLAAEFDLAAVISASGHEWEIAERIAATGRTLILPVAFPDKPDVREADDALGVSRRRMRRYVDAAAGPAALHDRGVRFALTTHGLKNTANFEKNVRKMIEAGLPEDLVLAALTTVPAELLGLERQLGRLEPGRIANVIIMDGPAFAEATKIVRVFVDGIEYRNEEKQKPQGDPNAVVDPRGEWAVVIEVGSRTIERTWTIRGGVDRYSGTAETRGGTVELESVELEGNVLTLVFSARGEGGPTEVTVVIDGETLEGQAQTGSRSARITGSRTSGPEGGER